MSMHDKADGLTKLEYLAGQILAARAGAGAVSWQGEQMAVSAAFDLAEMILQESERRQQRDREAEAVKRKVERERLEQEKQRAPFFVRAEYDTSASRLAGQPRYWGAVGRVGYEDEDQWPWFQTGFASEAAAFAAARTWAKENGTLVEDSEPFHVYTVQGADGKWMAEVFQVGVEQAADTEPLWQSPWRDTESHARSDAEEWVSDEESGRGHPGPSDDY